MTVETETINDTLPFLRQSERATFKRCQWRWYQENVVGIRPISEKGMELADFGTLFHEALAEYYAPTGQKAGGALRGPHPAETWQRVAGEMKTNVRTVNYVDDELVAKWEDFYELGLELCEAYVERYQGDPHWDILDAERRFRVLIPDVRVPRLESSKGRRIYTPIVKLVGTMDLCFRDLNQEHKGRPVVKALDHKTVTSFATQHLTLDEQASTYIAVATHALVEQGLIEKGEVVKGMEYNFIKRSKLDVRPRDAQGLAHNKPVKRHYAEAMPDIVRPDKLKLDELEALAFQRGLVVYGEVSADQSGENFMRYFVPRNPAERQRQIVRISEEARVMDMVRKGELPILKTPTRDCQYCKFFDLCELDESGGDTEYFIQTTMKKYDAYADHRSGASNSKKVGDGSTAERQGTA